MIEELGARWQVTFAPEKTEAMVCSRSLTAKAVMAGRVFFGSDALQLKEEVNILGVVLDQRLMFASHVKTTPKKASQRIYALRRGAGFLDWKGRIML